MPAPSFQSSSLPSSSDQAPVTGWQVGRCGATGAGADCPFRVSRRNPAGMDDRIQPHCMVIKMIWSVGEEGNARGWGGFQCHTDDSCSGAGVRNRTVAVPVPVPNGTGDCRRGAQSSALVHAGHRPEIRRAGRSTGNYGNRTQEVTHEHHVEPAPYGHSASDPLVGRDEPMIRNLRAKLEEVDHMHCVGVEDEPPRTLANVGILPAGKPDLGIGQQA